QLGKDQALTARDTDDGIYTFGEAIDSLDAATKTPDPPFSMSANPSPKLPYGIEAAQPGHPFHARWETWARTFWRSVAAEQAAGHLTPGFLYAYGMEMTGWYERVGTTAAYSIHPKSGRNPDVYGYAFAVEQRIAREEGADARFVFAPNTPISARRPIIEAAAASIRQHGGTVDVASMSFYTYGSDSHYPLTSSSRSGLPLDQALDYMHGVFPHSALGINETGTKRGQLDRVRKAVETFQVAADYDAVNVNLFCALKGEGDYRVFSDGTPTMDTPKDRGERAAIVAAAHDYIQAGR
ncbi:MAG: hypothetical protein GY929_21045, partial [Actinomycetia bacterium]|nr:hypothetical protein [Actinomycetes bacterium]